jgi:hypothetical protein
MKPLLPCYALILGLTLSAFAQTDKPPGKPLPNDHIQLCQQLGLVKGGEYIIETGSPKDQQPSIYTIVSLGDRGWITVMQRTRRIEAGPKFINLGEVTSIMKVEKNQNAVPRNPAGDQKPEN